MYYIFESRCFPVFVRFGFGFRQRPFAAMMMGAGRATHVNDTWTVSRSVVCAFLVVTAAAAAAVMVVLRALVTSSAINEPCRRTHDMPPPLAAVWVHRCTTCTHLLHKANTFDDHPTPQVCGQSTLLLCSNVCRIII